MAELKETRASLQAGSGTVGFQAVSMEYFEELLSEIAEALVEETALCRRLALDAATLSGQERERLLLLSSAWTARPCVPEARLRSLRDAVALELA